MINSRLLSIAFKSKFFNNFFFISVNQGINFVSLILVVPYLVKTVGVEKFGVITIMQTICSFFFIVVDYGFSVTSVRKLSLSKGEKEKISEIVMDTIATKIVLIILSFPFFLAATFYFLKGQFEINYVFIGFITVIGQCFFPSWLCLGLEDNKSLLFFNILNKILLLILIFFLILIPEDFKLYLLFLGLSNFIFGVWLTLFISRRYKLKFNTKNIKVYNLAIQLKEGKEVFISNLFVSLYLNSNVLLLSKFGSVKEVGLYGIAEKIMFIIRTILGVFIYSIYPKTSKLASETNILKTVQYLKKFCFPMIVAIFLLCFFLYFTSNLWSSIFTDSYVNELSILLELVAFIPLVVALNVPFNIFLLSYMQEKVKSYIIFISTLVCLLLAYNLIPIYKLRGLIFTNYFTEFIILIGLVLNSFHVYKKIWKKFTETRV